MPMERLELSPRYACLGRLVRRSYCPPGTSAHAPAAFGEPSEKSSTVQSEGHGALIRKLDVDHGLKHTCCHRRSERSILIH